MYKRKYIVNIFCFILLFATFFAISPLSVKAAKNTKDDKEKVYCSLCTKDKDDPLYQKEVQFYDKIKTIKRVFGNSIDEVVLAATVLHRYDQDVLYETEYEENFDKSSYQSKWGNLKTTKQSGSSSDISEEDAARIQKNEQLDLLTTAAIVMLDSNHFGEYSDVCYKDALTGDKLVGNDNNLFGGFLNAIACFGYQTINLVEAVNPLSFVTSFFNGDNIFVTAQSAKNKLVNTQKVCENGYIGGLYNGVADIQDEEQKQATKEVYAQQIIDLANYYKLLYGDLDSSGQCANNVAGATGAFSSWRQFDDKWGDISLGGSAPMRQIGCLVTSISMQIARSGTSIGTLPSDYSDFDPGAFVTSLNENGGFASGGNYAWTGQQKIAPNWNFGQFVNLNISDNKKLADAVSNELNNPYDEKYQKFLVLQIHHSGSSQHWVAVNGVSNNEVTIYDPAASGTTLDANYTGWVVDGYQVMYAKDVNFGETGTSANNSCNSGDDLNRFIGFLAYNEGHQTCNFQGRGEGTGYTASTLAGDAGGQTTAFGITISDKDVADKIGYTTFSSELYSGCTNKEDTERLLVATIDYMANDWTQKQIDQIGITVNQHEKYALMSVNYGGITLAVPIMEAIKTYGTESEQVFEAFKHSFGVQYALNNGFHGLMRRRLTEYEIFMTGNYEAESSNYLTMPYIQNGLAMSKSEVMSHWPTKRDSDLEGFDFAPISGDYSSSSSGDLVCQNGKAVSSGTSGSTNSGGLSGVVECAKQQLGKPYIWSHKGPDSFDCSGLTYYCYLTALGVDITGGSAIQWDDHTHFTDVASIDDLVPGDLICSRGGGHVSIYIGDGQVIHASSPSVGVIQSPAAYHTGPLRYKHYKG